MNLGTIVTAMVTPFDERGTLDLKEAQRVANWLIERGNDGLVVAGSTGEGQMLDDRERNTLYAAVKDAAGDRACVIANAGTNDTRASVAAAKAAAAAGADALLAVVPYYNKPAQSGMIAHFGAIADATPLPVIIYNIPGRTGANILPDTLFEVVRGHANVRGVKESSGDLKQIAFVLKNRPPEFRVWAGDDHLFLPCLAMGADGVVGVASHFCSREYRAMWEAFVKGDTKTAARLHLELLPLIDTLFSVTNPIGVKWAMRQLGFAVGECRLPLDAMPTEAARLLEPIIAPYKPNA